MVKDYTIVQSMKQHLAFVVSMRPISLLSYYMLQESLIDHYPFRQILRIFYGLCNGKPMEGIITHYNNSLVPMGDANTETTSLTLISFNYSPD